MNAQEVIAQSLEVRLGTCETWAGKILDDLAAAEFAVLKLPTVANKGPDDTDAKFFRQVAERIQEGRGRELGGSNVCRAVRDLLLAAAEAADRANPGPRLEPRKCSLCQRERTIHDAYDYNPLQALTGKPLGWYSGDTGEEVCPECLTKTILGGVL